MVLGSLAVIGARAAPSADLTGHHTVGDKLAAGLLAHRQHAVARFEVLQSDRLAVLHENGLVVDCHRLFTLPRVAELDLVPIDRNDLPESPVAAKALHFLARDTVHDQSDKLLVLVRAAPDEDAVARLQVLKMEVLRGVPPPLLVLSLIVHHNGLRCTVHLLDLEAVHSNRCDRSEYAVVPLRLFLAPWIASLSLSLSLAVGGLVLTCGAYEAAGQQQARHQRRQNVFAHSILLQA